MAKLISKGGRGSRYSSSNGGALSFHRGGYTIGITGAPGAGAVTAVFRDSQLENLAAGVFLLAAGSFS